LVGAREIESMPVDDGAAGQNQPNRLEIVKIEAVEGA
jgi:hypothetical protein